MRIRISCVTLLLLAACEPAAVVWDEAEPMPPNLASTALLEFDSEARLVPAAHPAIPHPSFEGQCVASVRMARDTTGEWYAAWWSVRPDSTASIVVSRSPDGVAWLPPVSVDTADTSPAGCTRPPPAIAADAGNVHVAYAMTAPEGPGIFASHSMDRGMMFHAPVAVVYGERIGRTAIGARADFVAVAFEDPNSSVPRIGVAFSRTMAHGFESREIVSPASTPARDPAVAVTLGRIAVSWAVGREGDASARRILRRGDLR